MAARADRPVPSRRAISPTAALVVLTLGAGALLLYAARHLTFFYDEWDFILGRRGSSLASYLDPHNGHLTLFPVIVYKLLLAIVGMRHYWLYQAIEVSLHMLCGVLLYVLARRRLGPWLALAPAVLLLFMGSAYQDLLWPFQIAFLASMAGGLGALGFLDRGAGPRADAGACALLLWSLSASSVGIPFLAAVAVLLIAQHANPWRAWVVVVPAVLYTLWYLGWGTSESPTSQSLLGSTEYVADAAAGAVAGIAGLADSWGPPLAVATLIALLVRVRGRHAAPAPMLIAAAIGGLAFWWLAAIARGDLTQPDSSRYLYVGAAFILLIASEAAAGAKPSRIELAGIAGLVVIAVVGNVSLLRGAERSYRSADESVQASLEAVQVAAPVVSPTFVPEPQDAPQVQAGPYLSAVRQFGSPALTLQQLEQAPGSVTEEADNVLAHAEALAPVRARARAAADRPVLVDSTTTGRIERLGLCERYMPAGMTSVGDFAVAPGAELLLAPASGSGPNIYLRRFAAQFSIGQPVFARITGGERVAIRFPVDRAPALSWHVRLTGTSPVVVCMR